MDQGREIMAASTQTRAVTGFNRVQLRGYGDIFLTQGPEERLTITAEEALLPKLISEVRGGILLLDQDRSWLDWINFQNSPIRYELTVKTIVGVEISGSGSLTAGQIESQAMDLGVSGSGRIRIASLQTPKLEVKVSGSGEIQLAGRAALQKVRSSGSAKLHALDLAGEDVEIRIGGSGEVWVSAENSLTVDISGSGSVHYRGSPRLSQHVSGSGRFEAVH
jgi:hypothetical protein